MAWVQYIKKSIDKESPPRFLTFAWRTLNFQNRHHSTYFLSSVLLSSSFYLICSLCQIVKGFESFLLCSAPVFFSEEGWGSFQVYYSHSKSSVLPRVLYASAPAFLCARLRFFGYNSTRMTMSLPGGAMRRGKVWRGSNGQ